MTHREPGLALAAARDVKWALLAADLNSWRHAYKRLTDAGNLLLEAPVDVQAECGSSDWSELYLELSSLQNLAEGGLKMCAAAMQASCPQDGCVATGATVAYSG